MNNHLFYLALTCPNDISFSIGSYQNTNPGFDGGLFTYGAEITFSCPSGTTLEGDNTIVCTQSETWHSDATQLIGDLLLVKLCPHSLHSTKQIDSTLYLHEV